jgi:hypothetical protein
MFFYKWGQSQLHAEVEPNGFRSFLAAEAVKLKEFSELVRLTTEALKDSQGSHAASTAPTLPQVWSKFGASPDMDSAKLFGTHIHRFNVQALSKTMQPVGEALEKHVELLDKLRMIRSHQPGTRLYCTYPSLTPWDARPSGSISIGNDCVANRQRLGCLV